MSERSFLDTNILVYLFDQDAPTKQRQVREFLSHPDSGENLLLSTQVLQEFYVSVTRKLAVPLGPAEAGKAVRALAAWSVVQVDTPLIFAAIGRSQTAKLSFWDALIVEAALAGGAVSLYSEDLQDGRTFEGMKIINPFRQGFRLTRTPR